MRLEGAASLYNPGRSVHSFRKWLSRLEPAVLRFCGSVVLWFVVCGLWFVTYSLKPVA